MLNIKDIKSIEIYGREWWRDGRNGGGCYFMAKIYVNDQQLHKTPLMRGIDSQYIWDLIQWLQCQGLEIGKGARDLKEFCQQNNIKLLTYMEEYTRQRDLKNW